jgi:hypothetical protein
MGKKLSAEVAGIAPLFLLRRANSAFIRKKITVDLSFYVLLPIVLSSNNDYNLN